MILAETNDPKVARALASKLGNFFSGQDVVAALKKMGSVAEEALIETAPSSNADVALAAVALLGDCGTEKCYPLLRQAMKSRNRMVKEAAKNSLTRIRTRLAAGPQEDATSDDSDSPFAPSATPSAAAAILNAKKPRVNEGEKKSIA